MKFEEFIFSSYTFDNNTGILRMHYFYKDGPDFEETIALPLPAKPLSKDENDALDRCCRLIFLMSGVSYYKAYAPHRLSCQQFPINFAMSTFLKKVYLNGLGEFAFRNNLDLANNINFSINNDTPINPIRLHPTSNLLVPVGGGKDSIVTIETLKKKGIPFTLFALGNEKGVATPILDTINVSKVPAIFVKRSIASNLLDLNNKDAFNGHIPITAILSSIACAVAVMHRFKSVVLSNEHSASAPNLRIGSFHINHQYSKSIEFERDFSNFIRHYISTDLNYYSLIRSLTEAEVVRRFSLLNEYHAVFRSCNKSFRQDDNKRLDKWCCACPKCRFIFLALAPFLGKNHVLKIFGENLLDDEKQLEGFKELCGFGPYKPFECVGDIEECKLLMYKLYTMRDWENDSIVKYVGRDILNSVANFDQRYRALFESRHKSFAPMKLRNIIDEIQPIDK